MIDPAKSAKLTVIKHIDKWESAFGDAVFIFKVENVETNQEFTKMVHFDSTDDLPEQSVEFLNLAVGKTYKVTEIPVSRYTLEKVESMGTTNMKKNADDSTVVTTLENDSLSSTCYVTIQDDTNITDTVNTVKYTNKLTYYDKFSHNSYEPNQVEKSAMVTSVSFEYKGGIIQKPFGNDKLDLSTITDNFVVKIYLDDEKQAPIVLPYGETGSDPKIGYYIIKDDIEYEGTGDEQKEIDYIKDGNLYYLDYNHNQTITIEVVLPDTSDYTWATSTHTDHDDVFIKMPDMPKPITLTFHTESKQNGVDVASAYFANKDDSTDHSKTTLTRVYEFDPNTLKYVLSTTKSHDDYSKPTGGGTYSFRHWTDGTGVAIMTADTGHL